MSRGTWLNVIKTWIVCGLVSTLMGCGATHTAVNKRNLDVQTKMSSTIFLDPVTCDKQKVFLQVRNTSDKPGLDLDEGLRVALENKCYTLVQNIEQAHYLLQVNVLQVGRSDLRAAEHALNQGFGAALSGAAAGAAVGSLAGNHNNSKGMVIGGLMGAAVATVTDAMIQDVVYAVIADVQVSERISNSLVVKAKNKSVLQQGTGTQEVTSTERINWKRYQTRVVSTANKVNLKFEKALPELRQGLTRSIAGVF